MSVQPIFRNPDYLQELPFRKWLRENMPTPRDGFVVEDLDLLLRCYGPNYHTDDKGCFMLVEVKYGNADLGHAQRRTFGLINQLLRLADPKRERYMGFYLIQYSDPDWSYADFKINRRPVTGEQFTSFLNFEYSPPTYFEVTE